MRIIFSQLLFICLFHILTIHAEKPQLTVVIVIDQCAYDYFPKLKKYFKYGLKTLLDNGIVYTHAYHPHGMPATATGHTALNTGTFAHRHGIVNNEWLNGDDQPISADHDPSPEAAVFSPTGTYPYNKSACNIMVDGISDQIILHNDPHHITDVFSISLKSRAAICMAGKLGKAIWFDPISRYFTSSKAYFAEIPKWITDYNINAKLNTIQTIFWKTCYPKNSPAYHFKFSNNYDFAGLLPLAGKKTVAPMGTDQYKDPIELNPMGNQICLDLALQCIKTHISKKSPHSMLLWISLSSLDLIGHQFGPDCLETIDTVYHIDKQLKKFMEQTTKHVDKNNTLFIITADHGIESIPEILAQKGIPARRLPVDDWIPELNELISKELTIPTLIYTKFYPPYLYFNNTLFNQLDQLQKNRATAIIKEYLMHKKGIKKVWDYKELEDTCFQHESPEYFFRQQLYPGRSGPIIIQTDPFNQLNGYSTGTDHSTPYEPNTHVPLIIYQPGTYTQKIINQKVWTLQLANTLAYILKTSQPSASNFSILPGITKND